jgi:hypothetical protein
MWTNSDKNEKAFTSAIIALILFCIFEPFLIFWLGYFCGWLAKIFIGSHLVEGLNLLHISIEINQIPLFTGVIAWIGSFFKNTANINKNN